MDEHDDGGCAFPGRGDDDGREVPGMTLLDYFAGQVFSGFAADPTFCLGDRDGTLEDLRVAAACAYQCADALIREKRRRAQATVEADRATLAARARQRDS